MTRKISRAGVIPVRQRTGGVYRLWCSDRHYYVGRSSNIEGRCSGHRKKLERGKHPNPHMQAVFNKYGEFRYEVVAVAGRVASIRLEQGLLDTHLSDPLCMNICASAEIPSRKGARNTPEHNAKISAGLRGGAHSEETRARMSAGQKRRFKDGWSPEFREAMGATRDTPEYREKLSVALRGRSLPKETRVKIGDAVRGREKSEEERARISAALKGREFTEKHRKKLSEAMRGKRHSEETKAKMRASQARRREQEREKA